MTTCDECLKVLRGLVETVEAAGGLVDTGLTFEPVGDRTWSDLGDVALEAHQVLKRAGWESKLTVVEEDKKDD